MGVVSKMAQPHMGFRELEWDSVKILLRHIQRRFAEGGELPAYLGCIDSVLYECYLDCEKQDQKTLPADTVRRVLRQMDRRRGKIAEPIFPGDGQRPNICWKLPGSVWGLSMGW